MSLFFVVVVVEYRCLRICIYLRNSFCLRLFVVAFIVVFVFVSLFIFIFVFVFFILFVVVVVAFVVFVVFAFVFVLVVVLARALVLDSLLFQDNTLGGLRHCRRLGGG